MFLLTIIEDKIKIPPELFHLDQTNVLIAQIEKSYVNKVIPEVGLCISFFDFESIGDPFVYPAEGAVHRYLKTNDLLTFFICASFQRYKIPNSRF